jgi:hypothetical protein
MCRLQERDIEEENDCFGGDSEELQARFISSEELHAALLIWAELRASSIFAFFVH